MLARQLVDPPLQGLAQAEIVAAQRQHRFRQHRPVQPVRQRHRHLHHAPAAGFRGGRGAHDLPALDQAKAGRDLHGMIGRAGHDVGGDPGARQPLERLAEPGIAVAAGFAVGGDQQVMRGQVQDARHLAPGIQPRHQLADAIDQDVLVEQCGQPPHRRHHRHRHPVVGIAQDAQVGPRRQRKDRMLHRGHVVLGQCAQDVADKEIAAMPVGQEARPLPHRDTARPLFHHAPPPALLPLPPVPLTGADTRCGTSWFH